MYIILVTDSEGNRRPFYDLGTDRGTVSSMYEGLERIKLACDRLQCWGFVRNKL